MPTPKSHLVLRSSTWHCRLDIPADLRPAYGNRRILSKSLKTGDKLLARELAATLIGQWKAEFRLKRDTRTRAGDKWREEIHQESLRYNASMDDLFLRTMRGQSDTPNSPDDAAGGAAIRALIDDLARDKRHDLLIEFRDLMAEGHTPETKPLWVQRYNAWFQKVMVHRLSAQHALAPTQAAEAVTLFADPASYKPKSPLSSTAQARFAIFLAEQNPNQRTCNIYLSHIQRFSTWLTTNGKELNFDAVSEYLDSVSKSRQTRIGHLAALAKFHKWAVRYDQYYREVMLGKANPFEGHEHARAGDNAGSSWAIYTREEAEQLHAAALAKADTDLADLIAFACYTGCRIEELGRIRHETTIFNDQGVPIGFRVDESKTESGIRDIPLHPAITPVYIRRLQKPQGTTKALFPGNDKTKAGLRLNALSQRFTKLKRQSGFSDKYVFHSFRKTTTTQLQQAHVPPLVIPFLLGHAVGSITWDIYSAGPTFETKADAIRALHYNFSLQ